MELGREPMPGGWVTICASCPGEGEAGQRAVHRPYRQQT